MCILVDRARTYTGSVITGLKVEFTVKLESILAGNIGSTTEGEQIRASVILGVDECESHLTAVIPSIERHVVDESKQGLIIQRREIEHEYVDGVLSQIVVPHHAGRIQRINKTRRAGLRSPDVKACIGVIKSTL